ncbi:lipid-A-disaccharide synthase [Marichromatium gracile]|uniref:Lipid-A-disaccharide synthase n=1 Tax=Marichromatium gracile TaxID=1048 RepID=A0ABR5VFP8_MARGR|nr:lipid-A-disaccharide synthase [Marichromatium gracile]KXX64387.1 lipid-A-disaccharide synthase [Marichromatium gracile]MCF1181912.1 lipid-A-disaccharide synthase [Marichromatium gracile]
MLTIGIVANEPSGDLLGAAVVRELQRQLGDTRVRFVGVAGPRMQALGCESLFDMERLSVMGLTEVLGQLRELLGLRRELLRFMLRERPAVLIGVDAPDFNLGLERRARRAGIRTVHLVSPTVWAWRPGRVKGIRRAVDLMLSIFPFEERFLREHGVPARYVGHPLADEIPFEVDRAAARAELGLDPEAPLVALLPGSRMGEVERLAAPFIETARAAHAARPGLRFVVPLINARVGERFRAELQRCAPELPLTLLEGQGREAMSAADVVLTASGTATLEGLLLGRPMLVGYRLHPLTYHLVKQLGLVKVPHIAMANLLAGRELAPEFVQSRCRAELLAPALLELLDDQARRAEIEREYARIHRDLRCDAAREAARAVLDLIGETPR